MKRLVLFPLAAALALVFSSSASANYWRHCGDQNHTGTGWYNVKAHGIGCGGAREVARHWGGQIESEPLGFSCRFYSAGYELGNVVCRREQGSRVQKVRFQTGA